MNDEQYNTLLKMMHEGFSTVHGELATIKTELAKKADAAEVNQRLDAIEAELAKKADAADMDRRFEAMNSRMDTIEAELAKKADAAALDRLATAVEDGLQEVLDAVAEERTAHDKAVDDELSRHHGWIGQIASHTGTGLKPAHGRRS
ncbi:hypothetical protein [Nocardia mexicana]|uniref:hypothetical protein n=1 Tax=Nocardia mexicana TaxID=279262 RepID=UPI0011C051AC|nr:hypothetical protein [Nocardia mexicana]